MNDRGNFQSHEMGWNALIWILRNICGSPRSVIPSLPAAADACTQHVCKPIVTIHPQHRGSKWLTRRCDIKPYHPKFPFKPEGLVCFSGSLLSYLGLDISNTYHRATSNGEHPTMSSDPSSSGIVQKADQIAFHFYTKLFYTVNQARATEEAHSQGKIDKWVREIDLVARIYPPFDIYSSTLKHPTRTSSQERPVNLTETYLYHRPRVHHL